jgi:hypothetical protein
MTKAHEEFVEKYGETPLEMLCEALWSQQNEYTLDDKKISLGSVVKKDAINCHGLAEYYFGDDGYVEFSFRDGNLDGTVVESYGDKTEFKPTRTIRVFALDEVRLMLMGRTDEEIERSRELFRLKEKEIKEMQGKMQYDLYFSPTSKVLDYYNEYAEKMCLKIEFKTINVDY